MQLESELFVQKVLEMTNKKKVAFFDLETCPLPDAILGARMPEFKAPDNYKKPEAIEKNIKEQELKWIEDAALSPISGEILAAIWVDENSGYEIADADEIGEAALISWLFDRIRGSGQGSKYKVGTFNGRNFDTEFLIKRAWANGVKIPDGIINGKSKWFDLPPWMFDIRDLWSFGDKFAKGTLGDIAEFLGVGEKTGDGAIFHKLWRDPSRRAEAEAYLINDGLLMPLITEKLLSLSGDNYGLNLQNKD